MLRGTAKTEELLPDRWKAAHPEAVREYREQERWDKADTAIVQAARRRVRAELRKANNTSNRSHGPRVEDATDPARDPWCRHRPPGPVHLRGGHHLLPICQPDGPENPSSHRKSLTNPRRISKPELQ